MQTRIMKYFSRQLLVKHEFLRQFEGEGYKVAEREIDTLIDLNLFLNVVDMEPRSIQQVCSLWRKNHCTDFHRSLPFLPPFLPSAHKGRSTVP